MEETIKRILKTADGQEFAIYLAEKTLELDTLSGIDTSNPTAAAIEVRARELAAEKLKSVLGAFVQAKQPTPAPRNPGEYAV